jgi:hypothetical protein
MAQFYISSNDPDDDLRRCRESQGYRQPITITGATENGGWKAFTGVVQAIEETVSAPKARRWRVTILD